MQKYLLILLLIFTIGCGQKSIIPLNEDPIITKYFNDEEIEELDQILTFFENQIKISTNTETINDAYELFFNKIDSATNPFEIDLNISFTDQENLFSNLNPQLFNEIWFYRTEYIPSINDSAKSMHYNWYGKYFDFLINVSEKDESINEYFNVFTAMADIPPSILAGAMRDYQKYNLKLKRIRLIIAINYLTFNEQLRLLETQRSK